MISPADQWCIEIDVTNACPGACSNCTRFTRLVAQPTHMDVGTFRKAVNSLAGYSGVIGIMGGEPTIHPQFPELLRIFRERWHPEMTAADGREVMEDFGTYMRCHAPGKWHPGRRVLFTSLGDGYYEHFEAIQDTFHQQGVNTHINGTLHQALLVTRKEYGISDAAWPAIRNRCWIQRNWSASITSRGTFFCEVAGAMDMLYAGISDSRRDELGMPPSGGWPIEHDWWRRKPEEFGKQLGWCELCGACLQTPKIEANACRQQISPWHADRLKEIHSPCRALQILTPSEMRWHEATPDADPDWYVPKGQKQARATDHRLHPRKIEAIIVSDGCAGELRRTLPGRISQFDHCIIVTSSEDQATARLAQDIGATCVVTDAAYENHDAFNKAAMMNAGLDALKYKDWVVFTDADIFFQPGWRDSINRYVLNPGCLYYTRRWYLPEGATKPDKKLRTEDHKRDPCGSDGPWGYFQLWNTRASAFAGRPLRFPLCFPTAGTLDHWFKLQWSDDKIIHMPDRDSLEVYHLWHGPFSTRWGGKQRGDPTRWQYVGQTDLHGDAHIQSKFAVPCWVRRVEVPTTIEETRFYDGRPIRWAFPQKPNTLYAFSMRRER